MFSRTPGKARRRSNYAAPSTARKEPPMYDTPLDELMASLDRIEELVEKTRRDFYEKPAMEPSKPKGALYLFRSRSDRRNTKEETPPAPPPAETSPSTPSFWRRKEKEAKFIPMEPQEEEEMIELLRRVAELVITGEKSAAAALSRNEKRSRRQTSGESTGGEDEKDADSDSPEDIDSHIALFEQFFERNALERIVSIVTGAAFSTPPPPIETQASSSESGEKDQEKDVDSAEKSDEGNGAEEKDAPGEESPVKDQPDDELASSEKKSFNDPDTTGKAVPEVNPCTMLPSLAIATQAIQSVSILIQNVSRATSLYFLLSNNLINDLIALPLELYSTAEKNQQFGSSSPPSPGKRFTSAEVAELATHFVTFLKSLALRMNVETLQFFLSYPGERAGEGSEAASSAHFSEEEGTPPFIKTDYGSGMAELDGCPVIVETVQVEFPLYARALEFCSAHQDSFVRVTAMNICLNTLRLATVGDDMRGSGLAKPEREHGASPDGVLHNAQPLPLRERLAIAQHVCSPSRVEELVSPIFTKLAQLWGVLEEQFREAETDARRGSVTDLTSVADEGVKKKRNVKLQKAKEEAKRKKLVESFRASVADLHDELLLLEDVFKVGLTSLNEQIIEMMLATFVYPLLLQPLLQYIQRLPSAQEGGAKRRLSNAFSGDITTDASSQSGIFGEGGAALNSHESAPAKTAIFALASVFHFITNRPLLRLLLTALLHPLSPNATNESMIRALPDVACAGRHGVVCVRIDCLIAGMTENEKLTYSFGKVTGRTRARSGSIGDSDNGSLSDTNCVFVLSPALVEILEGDPGDAALITRSRPNPYRQALMRFFVGGPGMEHIKGMSILLIDSLATKFDGKFLGDLLFGSGMKRFGDEIPVDERSLDARNAHLADDRGIGGGGFIDSRRSLANTSSRIGTDYLVEAVTALCIGIVNTSPGQSGLWKLEYDEIAAHALLCAVSSNNLALQSASKLLDRRRRQTAAFLAQMPARIDYASMTTTGHHSLSFEDEESGFGATLDKIVHESVRGGKLSILEELLLSKDQIGENKDYALSVSLESSFQDLTERTCILMSSAGSGDEDVDIEDPLQIAASAMLGLFRLDALSNLLQELAATGGGVLQKRRLAGFSFSSNGTIVDTAMCLEDSMHRKVFAPLSKDFASSVLDQDDDSGRDKGQPAAGSVVGLVGRTAFPCVCEVPAASASLFTDSTGISSEGVQWQSLYLVFFGRYMILAEPEKGGSGGDGRVVTSCKLAQVHVEKDTTPSAATGSSARRLLISHDSFDKKPPGLFLFDESPLESNVGPFKQLRKTRSSLDVWFEDDNASEQAFSVLEAKIAKAKAKRGNRLRDKLAPEDRMRYDPS